MNPRETLAIIGSGASSIYLLKHLLDHVEVLEQQVREIFIFEKNRIMGMGMPYSPQMTDIFNMSNISSEELPELPVTFGDWLRDQTPEVLEELGLSGEKISESEVYNRISLGRYLNAQYQTLVDRIKKTGIEIQEFPECEIADIRDEPSVQQVRLITAEGTEFEFGKVVISTGHSWSEEDKTGRGYFASPWPIFKLFPENGSYHNFPIGTLGASLSAFDVISSLAHRHGEFSEKTGKLAFHPHPGTENFKVVMHSSQGLLPHLQFDQVDPFREIYRHIDRDGLLDLIDADGFLRIDTYFDQVCRPVLKKAFAKDQMPELEKFISDPAVTFEDFCEKMTDKHEYDNAFEGMRFEMIEAKKSVLNHQPIHWKETIDDLMYTLNFHAGLMPAEDHLFLHSAVMPFLMNVIAAMPLPSADIILALYDAGKLEIIAGNVEIVDDEKKPEMTTVSIEHEGEKSTVHYRMFIDCSGQKPLEVEEFPFAGLVKKGVVRKARAAFHDPKQGVKNIPDQKKEHVFQEDGKPVYHVGGIDIDSAYRLVDSDGKASTRLSDIAFPHISGLRPYSYGLQACSHTSEIFVRSWVEEIRSNQNKAHDVPQITELYEKL